MPENDLVGQKSDGDGVEVLILKHPPVNALSSGVLETLSNRLTDLDAAAGTRCVVVTGDGQYFSAGADLKEMATLSLDRAPELLKRTHAVLDRLWAFRTPVIAAINGLALGGGLELALACDLRIAGDTAKLGATEVTLGLLPAAGGTQRLPRLVGVAKAKEWIFSGNMISGADALKFGLVNRTVPAGQELRAARDLAHTIAQRAPLAVQAAKRVIQRGSELPLADGLKLESEAFVKEVLPSQDLREGIAAFLERRPPKFQGA